MAEDGDIRRSLSHAHQCCSDSAPLCSRGDATVKPSGVNTMAENATEQRGLRPTVPTGPAREPWRPAESHCRGP